MADLVVTCPKNFFREWIAEGDAAGEPYTGEEWGWFMGGSKPDIGPGDRLYVVAWNLLRGYAPVTRLVQTERGWCICRRGDAVAVSIPEPIKGFRGWRRRWWDRSLERPFPEWKTYGVGESKRDLVDQALDELFGGPGSLDRAIARAFKGTKR